MSEERNAKLIEDVSCSDKLKEFKKNIKYYMSKFNEKKYSLKLYFDVINSSNITEVQLKDILCWKLGGNRKFDLLKKAHKKLINRALDKLHEINMFKQKDISKTEFDETLEYISPYGAIMRLFILHICKPKEYALFDQHVYRAFNFFQTGLIYKGSVTFSIAKRDYKKYCEFFNSLCGEYWDKYDPKQIDAALMVYGKGLKKSAK